MKIILKINGTMERYFPATEFNLCLKENASLADLYEELGKVAGDKISQAVWNHTKNRPRGPVIVSSESGVLKKDTHPLHEGQVIEMKRFLIGG